MKRKSAGPAGPIFVLGVQRSGTTLMRMILSSHSRIAMPGEAEVLRPILAKYGGGAIPAADIRPIVRYMRESPLMKRWNYDPGPFLKWLGRQGDLSLKDFISSFFDHYAKNEGKVRWGDKTPSFFRFLPLLHRIFPDAKFIHIIRDGRDVFDSWRKLDPTKDNAAVVALEWAYKLRQIGKFMGSLEPRAQLTIRYEDLLGSPQKTLRGICAFLGEKYEPRMAHFYKDSPYYVGGHHSKLIFQPIDPGNVEKWRKNITAREARFFDFLAGRTLAQYGYPKNKEGLTGWDILALAATLGTGLPRRLASVFGTGRKFKAALEGKKVRFKFGAKPLPRGRKRAIHEP
jgi:hypothetical protein